MPKLDTVDKQIKALEAKRAELLKAESAKRKEREEKRALVAGEAVLKHARAHPEFELQLRDILHEHVKGVRKRKLFNFTFDQAEIADETAGESAPDEPNITTNEVGYSMGHRLEEGPDEIKLKKEVKQVDAKLDKMGKRLGKALGVG